MQVKLTSSGEIQFLDGDHINRNSLNRKTLIVIPETALATRESLWVQFGDSQNFEDVNANILEPIRLSEEEDGYKTVFPDELVKQPGTWYMTLAVRVYSTDEATFSAQLTSDKISFTVNDSYPMDDDGYISNGTLENVWQQIQGAVEGAEDSANAAEQSAIAAQNAQSEAEAAQAAAEAAQAAAETAEENAKASETAAQGYANAASGSAGDAATSAGQAATSASQAANSATAAGQSASAAANSATQASQNASAAAVSAGDAADSALAAQGYMEQAKEYAQKEYKIYDSFDDLPIPGDSAFIYLVSTGTGTGNDTYSEYLWISEDNKYEYIGSVNDIDLSNYAQVNGTYPNMTVGNATHAASADSATKATQDGNGSNIAETYAKLNNIGIIKEMDEPLPNPTESDNYVVYDDVDKSLYVRKTYVTEDNTIYAPSSEYKYYYIVIGRSGVDFCDKYKIVWSTSDGISLTASLFSYRASLAGTLRISNNTYDSLDEAETAIKSNFTEYTQETSLMYFAKNASSQTITFPIINSNYDGDISYPASYRRRQNGVVMEYDWTYTKVNPYNPLNGYIEGTKTNNYSKLLDNEDAGNFAQINGTYPNLTAGSAERLQSQVNVTGVGNNGWYKLGSVTVAQLKTIQNVNASYSLILLVNGNNPSGVNANASATGAVEIDAAVSSSGVMLDTSGYSAIKVLFGDLEANNFAWLLNDAKDTLTVYFNATRNNVGLRQTFTVMNEAYGARDGRAFEFGWEYYGASAPANAVYAENRNIAGAAETLSRSIYINAQANGGWHKFAEFVPPANQGGNAITSAILLCNGINASESELSGLIEIDALYTLNTNEYTLQEIKILSGNLSAQKICGVQESDKISFYVNLATYRSYQFTVLSECSQMGGTLADTSGKSDYIQLQTNYYGASAPSGAVYAVNRNNAACDGDGNDIAATYATKSDLNAGLQKLYPVGSIYLSAVATNPATLFGFGTWQAWGTGRVPVGVDASQTEFDTAEKTGGEKEHSLTTDEMPAHTHILRYARTSNDSEIEFPWLNLDAVSYDAAAPAQDGEGDLFGSLTNVNAGGSQPHNNLQPYITCYMWKRTA